jgi:hypothetical protein
MTNPSPDEDEQKLEIWNQFLDQSGDEFEFRLARTPGAIIRDGEEYGFSEKAMNVLMDHLMIFIGTRMTRYNDEHKRMPQAMTVRVKVNTDNTFAEDWHDTADITVESNDTVTHKENS